MTTVAAWQFYFEGSDWVLWSALNESEDERVPYGPCAASPARDARWPTWNRGIGEGSARRAGLRWGMSEHFAAAVAASDESIDLLDEPAAVEP